MFRFLLGLVGAGALVAMMHKGIMAGTGEYGHDDAVTIMETLVVIAVAIAVVPIFRAHWLIGGVVLFALVAGDLARFGRVFIDEVNRLSAVQAPAIAAHKRYDAAQDRIKDAKAGLAALSVTSPRLARALSEQTRVSQMTSAAAGGRHFGRRNEADNKRQQQAAASNVTAARAELAAHRKTAEQRVSDAEQALRAMPIPPSISPTADIIGWVIKDAGSVGMIATLITAVLAALKSVSLNLGAIGLLAVGGHNLRLSTRLDDEPGARLETVGEQIARFALARYQPHAGAHLRLSDAYSEYRQWCRSEGVRVIPVKDFVAEFDRLAKHANLQTMRTNDNELVIRGMAGIKLLEAA